jgi:hypothetical protein
MTQPKRDSRWKPAFVLPTVISAILVALAAPAGAQVSQTPAAMLDNGIKNLHEKLVALLPTVKDAPSALEAIREFHDTRRLAQRVIAMDYPLDEFTGIVMNDTYDERYVASVDTLATRFASIDDTSPPAEAVQIFRDRLGELPPLNDTPAGFVIAFLISRCVTAASSLPSTLEAELRAGVIEIAVRSIGELAHGYMETRTGDLRQKSDDFWHLSVIERVRCGEHKSAYKLVEQRTGLRPDGSLYRRYVVTCEVGTEERKLDFDLGIMGDMSRTGGRQNLKTPVATPSKRKPGVEP